MTLELGVGDVRITASDRTDTSVEVRPSDAAKKSDATAAQQTRVEYSAGRLVVRAPKGWRQFSPRGGGESIDVEIALPAGSHVQGDAGIATFRCVGRLGECRLKTGVGEIRVEEAGPAELRTGIGDITVDRVLEHAEITTRSGSVRIASIAGTAVIKNSNGDSWVGETAGDLRVNAANGRISVDRAEACVVAKTANGDVRLGDVARGAVHAQTACGKLDVAIREGSAAWLDLTTHHGHVHNSLDAAGRPGPGEDAVEVRARTAFGDISIRRTPRPTVAEARA